MERVAKSRLLWLTFFCFLQLSGARATGRWLSHPDPLPPCSQKPGGVHGWDCYDPPNHPLRPCDFHHQRIGVDCSGWRPVTVNYARAHADAAAASPTTYTSFKSKTRPLLERHIAIDLPPCSLSSSTGGAGSTDSWQCLDAPTRHLPPALGSDAGEASDPATTAIVKGETLSTRAEIEEGTGHTAIDLPPCSLDSRGSAAGDSSTDSWQCSYDGARAKRHLPPCDTIHRIVGVNCSGRPPKFKWPPAGDVGRDRVTGEASDPASTVLAESETTSTRAERPGGP